MSRSSVPEYYVEKTIRNKPTKYDKRERVLLIDGDSILYTANYKSEDDIDRCKYKIRNRIQEITLSIEEDFNIVKTVIFVGGKNNFRYDIFPEYKKSRGEKHENIKILHEYMLELGALPSVYGEADDSVYTGFLMAEGNCVVATVDKDLKSFIYDCPIYNYSPNKKYMGSYETLSRDEADYNFVSQLLIGDQGDGVNLSVGIGPKYVEEHIYEGMTKYQYIKQLLIAYRKCWKDPKIAKTKLKLCYSLLKLYDIRQIKIGKEVE